MIAAILSPILTGLAIAILGAACVGTVVDDLHAAMPLWQIGGLLVVADALLAALHGHQ